MKLSDAQRIELEAKLIEHWNTIGAGTVKRRRAEVVTYIESLLPIPPTGTAQEQAGTREAFEAWQLSAYGNAGGLDRSQSGAYVNGAVGIAWAAWLAGHQAALTATAAPASREAQLQAVVDTLVASDEEMMTEVERVPHNAQTYRAAILRNDAAWQAARRLRSAEGTKG